MLISAGRGGKKLFRRNRPDMMEVGKGTEGDASVGGH